MELLCPHCLKRVTVSDDKAGQVLNCPLCNGVFAAPSLPGAPSAAAPPPPPAPSPATYSISPVIPPASPREEAPPPPPPPMPPPSPLPSVQASKPAPPPGSYSHRIAFGLRPDVLVWIPPACIFLIVFFFGSFFSWHIVLADRLIATERTRNLWQVAFADGSGLLIVYVVMMILAFLMSIACLLLEKRWLPPPPPIEPIMPWKSGATFGFLLVTFFFLAYDVQQGIFVLVSPIDLGEKVAFFLHVVALLAAGLELWAQSQRVKNLPIPRITVKW
jgi:hypothetical protein